MRRVTKLLPTTRYLANFKKPIVDSNQLIKNSTK